MIERSPSIDNKKTLKISKSRDRGDTSRSDKRQLTQRVDSRQKTGKNKKVLCDRVVLSQQKSLCLLKRSRDRGDLSQQLKTIKVSTGNKQQSTQGFDGYNNKKAPTKIES